MKYTFKLSKKYRYLIGRKNRSDTKITVSATNRKNMVQMKNHHRQMDENTIRHNTHVNIPVNTENISQLHAPFDMTVT